MKTTASGLRSKGIGADAAMQVVSEDTDSNVEVP